MSAEAAPSGRLALSNKDLETLSVNTIRTLCMDAIQAADSGRPGTLLAYDTQRTVADAKAPHARAARRNLFSEIPGTPEGLPEMEAITWAFRRVGRRARRRACCRDHPAARERDRPRTRTRLVHERADAALPHAQGLGGARWRQTSPCSSG